MYISVEDKEKKKKKRRKWFKRNKVIFETLGFVFFSVLAIVLSACSLWVTSYQINLDQLEHQPVIKVNFKEPLFDEYSNNTRITSPYQYSDRILIKYYENEMKFANTTALCYFDIKIKPHRLSSAENLSNKYDSTEHNLHILISSYYGKSFYCDQYNDTIIIDPINPDRYDLLSYYIGLIEKIKDDDLEVDSKINTYISISYTDIYGIAQKKYFNTNDRQFEEIKGPLSFINSEDDILFILKYLLNNRVSDDYIFSDSIGKPESIAEALRRFKWVS